ncbi:hypothetical protein Anas_07221 [Armadillidium nasatum]|uniref:Uncharacterized protein n=1 Tax=Armadillidium nasatum TaxID=96803 RepID=A0A5N5TC97_9CRUS|nr:hypothetical protein Anas_07221 [Armadillidium nasatum]
MKLMNILNLLQNLLRGRIFLVCSLLGLLFLFENILISGVLIILIFIFKSFYGKVYSKTEKISYENSSLGGDDHNSVNGARNISNNIEEERDVGVFDEEWNEGCNTGVECKGGVAGEEGCDCVNAGEEGNININISLNKENSSFKDPDNEGMEDNKDVSERNEGDIEDVCEGNEVSNEDGKGNERSNEAGGEEDGGCEYCGKEVDGEEKNLNGGECERGNTDSCEVNTIKIVNTIKYVTGSENNEAADKRDEENCHENEIRDDGRVSVNDMDEAINKDVCTINDGRK